MKMARKKEKMWLARSEFLASSQCKEIFCSLMSSLVTSYSILGSCLSLNECYILVGFLTLLLFSGIGIFTDAAAGTPIIDSSFMINWL